MTLMGKGWTRLPDTEEPSSGKDKELAVIDPSSFLASVPIGDTIHGIRHGLKLVILYEDI